MALVMVLAFAACGNDANTNGDDQQTNEKVLTMATSADFPPYEYYDGDSIVGIDIEIAQAVCEKLGYTLEIVDMNFDSIVAAVASHKYDFGMSGFTITEDRLEQVNFTDSYTTSKQVIVVPEGSDITTVDDLFAEGATYTVGVQTNTTGDLYITGDVEDNGLSLEISRFTKGTDAVVALTSGKIDCFVIDEQVGKAFAESNEGLKVLDTEYVVEDYAVIFAKDSEIYESFNTTLKELIADGTVQTIIDKYITE